MLALHVCCAIAFCTLSHKYASRAMLLHAPNLHWRCHTSPGRAATSFLRLAHHLCNPLCLQAPFTITKAAPVGDIFVDQEFDFDVTVTFFGVARSVKVVDSLPPAGLDTTAGSATWTSNVAGRSGGMSGSGGAGVARGSSLYRPDIKGVRCMCASCHCGRWDLYRTAGRECTVCL